MKEIIIDFEGTDPVEILGVNNRLLEKYSQFFPDLKFFSRGTTLAVSGQQQEIEVFNERIHALIELIRRGRRLDESELERLLDYKNYPSEAQEQKQAQYDVNIILYMGEMGI